MSRVEITMGKFKLGKCYTRREISDVIGGQLIHYLPNKDGEILCGCFNPIPTRSPDAPEEVIFGSKPHVRKMAKMMSEQSKPIPVFIKQRPRQWEYWGLYRCVDYSTDPALVRKASKAYPKRIGIAGVLYFEKV